MVLYSHDDKNSDGLCDECLILIYVTEVIAEVISVPSEYELIEGNQTVLEPSKTITIVAADLLVTYTINTQRETGESLYVKLLN